MNLSCGDNFLTMETNTVGIISPQLAEASENPSVAWNALVLNSAPSAISALINRWFFRQCPRR